MPCGAPGALPDGGGAEPPLQSVAPPFGCQTLPFQTPVESRATGPGSSQEPGHRGELRHDRSGCAEWPKAPARYDDAPCVQESGVRFPGSDDRMSRSTADAESVTLRDTTGGGGGGGLWRGREALIETGKSPYAKPCLLRPAPALTPADAVFDSSFPPQPTHTPHHRPVIHRPTQ